MRVIFMGTPSFAVPSLRCLAAQHQVVAVYSRPDAVSGRGRDTRPSPVRIAAQELGLPVSQPVSLREETSSDLLRALDADIICVAAYGLILPTHVLESARLGAVNVHASLLPRWRGAAPIQRAILAGDPDTGVSIMRMEEGLDTGPYCLQVTVPVAGKSAAELTTELAEAGAQALMDALPSIADESVVWTLQNDAEATYASKITKADVAPDPRLPARDNALRVMASMPTSPARLLLADKGLTLVEASVHSTESLAAGTVGVSAEGLLLGTIQGTLLVTQLKPDGKAEMPGTAWARGAHLTDTTVWESAR